MSEPENDQWIDELIRRTVNTTKPDFDPEKWKQEYPEAFQLLVSRATKVTSGASARPKVIRPFFAKPLVRIAAAAVLAVAVTFLLVYLGDNEQPGDTDGPQIVKSPAEMMTAMSLTRVYRRGGIEAMETQFDKTLKMLGPRPASLSLRELSRGFNG